MQPFGVRAPVVVLRAKRTIALSSEPAAYTDFPSLLTAAKTVLSSPLAVFGHPSGLWAGSAMHPLAVRAPVVKLRAKRTIALSWEPAAYTDFPSLLTVTDWGKSSPLAVFGQLSGLFAGSAMHPLGVRAPVGALLAQRTIASALSPAA